MYCIEFRSAAALIDFAISLESPIHVIDNWKLIINTGQWLNINILNEYKEKIEDNT